MREKPNVLILMSDEQRFDVLGFMGNEVVRTPNLDALAKDAVIFQNAYTPSPVCIPARQCFAVGQYPKTCNVQCYGEDLEPNSRTFARTFTENHYKTAAAGKLHHMGIDQMQGWEFRMAGDMEVSVNNYLRQSGKVPDAIDKLKTGMKWNDKKEILRAGPGNSSYARRDRLTIEGCSNFIYEHFVDSFYDRAEPDTPLMLYVGLLNPHYPYIAEEELFDYYLNRVSLYENQVPSVHPFLGRCANCPPLIVGEDVTEREIKRAMAAYYANIETTDRQFGQVLEELRNAGEDLDDWIIIFTSDHGEMLGEHSIWEKQRFYEGSVRVPLFIRYPKRFAPGNVQENVNLIDIYPTLCELCGIETPEAVEGRSMVSLMEGDASGWDNETLSQWGGRYLMIKRDHLKYHWYGDTRTELLFDLKKDPQENKNQMNEEGYQAAIEEFRKRRDELGF